MHVFYAHNRYYYGVFGHRRVSTIMDYYEGADTKFELEMAETIGGVLQVWKLKFGAPPG